MPKHTAVYIRVSSRQQKEASQLPEIERWIAAQDPEVPVRIYRDTFTGKTMDRAGWNTLHAEIRSGNVGTLVVWKLDRLGRTSRGLTALFEELRERKVNFVSLTEGIDLATPAGRMMAVILASVAAYETEIRAERVAAGQAAARARGKTWGGSKPGRRVKVSETHEQLARQMKTEGKPVTEIARVLGLSRPTIYEILRPVPMAS